jgi:Transcriptional regulatory protein, C terminal
LWIPG